MNKILLVYEDYPELMNVEGALKKIGFDVIGITHEYSIMEQVISFNPDVVVGCGRGGKVSSLGVGRRLKEMARWSGKTILIFASNNKPTGGDLLKIRSDIMLEAPVPPLRLIQVLAKLLGHDEGVLQERLNKMIHGEGGTATTPSAPTFSTAKAATKNENVKFVVGGNTNTAAEKTIVGGMNFNRAAENESIKGEEGAPSLFGRLRDRQDLYQSEEKSKASSEENLFAEVDLKSLERELKGEVEPTPTPAPVSTPAADPGSAASTSSPKSSVSSAKAGDAAEAVERDSSALSEEARVQGKTASEEAFEALVNSASEEISKVTSDFPQDAKEGDKEALILHQQEELSRAQGSVRERVAKYSEYLKAAPPAAQASVSQMTRTEARKRQRELVKDWDAEKLKDLDKLRREFTKALYKK